MSIRGISHMAIGVRDIDVSLPFYRDVLGLAVAFDGIEHFGGGGPGRPESSRRAVYLRHTDDVGAAFVVLDQQLGPVPPGGPATLFQIGLHHFGFWVDDVDAIAERARAAGYEIVREPGDADTVAYGEPPGGVIRMTFLRDPDGNVIQCDQRIVSDS